MKLIQGDCIVEMQKLIDEDIKVDLVLTDLPYGTTQCRWDNIIPFEPMWDCINGLSNERPPTLLFGNEPFSSYLRLSNLKNYRYDWYWNKTRPTGHLNAKKQPMRKIEEIMVFYKKQCSYYPQGLIAGEFNNNRPSKTKKKKGKYVYGKEKPIKLSKYTNYPNNVLEYSNPNNKTIHPTQKPVEMLEYLIRTYTNEGDIVLDFTMGSGSTGVACLQTNRNFIGIELDEKYYNIAKKRCSNYQSKLW